MSQEPEKILKSYLDQEKIPHALLFVSQDTDLMEQKALDFVFSVLKQKGAIESNLAKIKTGNHPDVILHEPFSKTGAYTIEQIKDICSKSPLYPHESPAQFFILKYAERMADAATNALLKTLEEPSTHSYFILLAQREEEIAPTLKSRLQKIIFEDQESSKETTKHHQILKTLLFSWPKFTFNELHLACIQMQEEIEKFAESKENLDKMLQISRERDALFLEIEKWAFQLENRPISYRKFEKIFEEAKIGVDRSIKLSICLESLLLNFIYA